MTVMTQIAVVMQRPSLKRFNHRKIKRVQLSQMVIHLLLGIKKRRLTISKLIRSELRPLTNLRRSAAGLFLTQTMTGSILGMNEP